MATGLTATVLHSCYHNVIILIMLLFKCFALRAKCFNHWGKTLLLNELSWVDTKYSQKKYSTSTNERACWNIWKVKHLQTLKGFLVHAVLYWVAIPWELPWNSLSLWTPCTADCFHRPEESFSGPCQDAKMRASNVSPVSGLSRNEEDCVWFPVQMQRCSYTFILCASLVVRRSVVVPDGSLSNTSLLVFKGEEGKADHSIALRFFLLHEGQQHFNRLEHFSSSKSVKGHQHMSA